MGWLVVWVGCGLAVAHWTATQKDRVQFPAAAENLRLITSASRHLKTVDPVWS